MGIDLSRFKVIHGDKVLNAVTLQCIQLPEGTDFPLKTSVIKPRFLEVLAINEDGNIIVIHDEAWRFQFLPAARNEAEHNKLEQVRQETVASMMEKLEKMQKDALYQAFDKELAKKDTKAAKRPCFNGLDKYTTQQLKEELRRRKGK